MDSLSINERGPPPPPSGGPQPPAQLPPQMFTTAAQLLDLTDKKLMLALRDGRKLIGVLRSWDQFANLVLQSTTERIFVTFPSTSSGSGTSPDPSQQQQPRGLYADIPHGIFLVRGENVLLLGEVDLDREDAPPRGYERGEVDVVKRMAEEQKKADRGREKRRLGKLAGLGFEGEGLGDMVL